jgi:hypothetical protein
VGKGDFETPSVDAKVIHPNRQNTADMIADFIVLNKSVQVPARMRVLVCVLGELIE